MSDARRATSRVFGIGFSVSSERRSGARWKRTTRETSGRRAGGRPPGIRGTRRGLRRAAACRAGADTRERGCLREAATSPSRRARQLRDVSAGVKRRRRSASPAGGRGDAPCTPTAYIVARSISAASRSSYSNDALPLSFSSLGTAEATACSCAARDVMAAASRFRDRSKRSRRFAHAARVLTPRLLTEVGPRDGRPLIRRVQM